MPADITTITYVIGQGEATTEDWEAFAAFAEARLRQDYPEAAITVELAGQDPDAGLWVETREDHDDDVPGHLYQARQEVEELVGRLWDEYSRQ